MFINFVLLFPILVIYSLTAIGKVSTDILRSKRQMDSNAMSSLPGSSLVQSIVSNGDDRAKLRKKRSITKFISSMLGSGDDDNAGESEESVAFFDSEDKSEEFSSAEMPENMDHGVIKVPLSHAGASITAESDAALSDIHHLFKDAESDEALSDIQHLFNEKPKSSSKKKTDKADRALSDIHQLFNEKKAPVTKISFDKSDAPLFDVHHLYHGKSSDPNVNTDQSDEILSDVKNLFRKKPKSSWKKKSDKADRVLSDIHHLFDEPKAPVVKKPFDKSDAPLFDIHHLFDENASSSSKVTADKSDETLPDVHHLFNDNHMANTFSTESVEQHISLLEGELTRFKFLNHEPMTLHYGKRAHAYRVCCKKMETDDMFNQYLTNFEYNFHNMDKMLRSCLHKQAVPDAITDTVYGGDCQVVYNELTEAMNKRQTYLTKHKAQSGAILENYKQAYTLKLGGISSIKAMEKMVEEYCPDQHVFELLSDAEKFMHCDALIRRALVKTGEKDYHLYEREIATPFLIEALKIWVNLQQAYINTGSMLNVVANQADTISHHNAAAHRNPALSNDIISNKPPIAEHMPPSNTELLAQSTASSYIISIYFIFQIFFTIILHFISF